MAHKRKDTFARVQEWAKHLRPFEKRKQAKAERRAAKDEVEFQGKEYHSDIESDGNGNLTWNREK